jgi:hypothetical protein
MQAVTGVFLSRNDADRAAKRLRTEQVPADRITVLYPGNLENEIAAVPVVAGEETGMGKVMGAVVGAAAGISAEGLLFALIPGVGPVTVLGLYGAAILAAAGASIGAATGAKLENSMTEGLPEDEIFVYEDALRKGRSVVIALAQDEHEAASLRALLESEGAETVDAAREQWWIGLRSAEQEHYMKSGKDFGPVEKFYRLGFEAALHSKNRCKEFDQTSAEMDSMLEDIKHKYPGQDVEEPFTHGYQRGREYYQKLCDKESKAA